MIRSASRSALVTKSPGPLVETCRFSTSRKSFTKRFASAAGGLDHQVEVGTALHGRTPVVCKVGGIHGRGRKCARQRGGYGWAVQFGGKEWPRGCPPRSAGAFRSARTAMPTARMKSRSWLTSRQVAPWVQSSCFERLLAFDVEVVGRLVQQVEVGRLTGAAAASPAAPFGRRTACQAAWFANRV